MVSTYSGKGASHREGDEKVLRWGTWRRPVGRGGGV
jgi:hypothetical protein